MLWIRTACPIAVAVMLVAALALLQPEARVAVANVEVEMPTQPETVAVAFELVPPPPPPPVEESAAPATVHPSTPAPPSTPPAERVSRTVQGRFDYDDALAREGLALLDEAPLVIRADYGPIGYERYVAELRRFGARAFLVKKGDEPRFLAEINPLTGDVLNDSVDRPDVRGLATDLPREISGDDRSRWRLWRAADQLGQRGDLAVVLLLPREIEAYCRAALQRAVAAGGQDLRQFDTFVGKYVARGRRLELHLDRGVRRDGTTVDARVVLGFPSS